MRAIPGMTVLCPCDGNEMTLAVEALLAYDGPAYHASGPLWLWRPSPTPGPGL